MPVSKDGQKEYAHAYYLRNKERLKPIRQAWLHNNLARRKAWTKEYERTNAQKIAMRKRLYALNHEQLIRDRRRKYKLENRVILLEKARLYNSINRKKRMDYKLKRRATDVGFRIRESLSARISAAIKRQNTGTKSSKTVALLGCSISSFKIYLESKFEIGMSWSNYGVNGWHIDHIMPCSIFDLSNAEHQKRCFHFSNLQPMWATENRKKSNRIPQQVQSE